MPRTYRLTVADLKTFRPKRRIHGTYFSIAIAPSSRVQTACVVSKKVSLKAVTRNLIKRRFRSVLSSSVLQLSPAAYVWYAKKEAASATFQEIKNDIEKLVVRARA